MPTPETSSPDYGHGDDWRFIEDVDTAGSFEFSVDREVETPLVRETVHEVACLVGNPSADLLQAAELSAVSKIDALVTVWASTLFQTDADGEDHFIEPCEGDKITCNGCLWLINKVISTVFGTQFKCFCTRLAKA